MLANVGHDAERQQRDAPAVRGEIVGVEGELLIVRHDVDGESCGEVLSVSGMLLDVVFVTAEVCRLIDL